MKNFHAAPQHVLHSKLERFCETSEFRSSCPACGEGILLVARDPVTLKIVNVDRCITCLQLFVYDDKVIGGEEVSQMKELPVPATPL